MIHLRPYQQSLITDVRAAFRAHKSVLMVAPTGAGKTVMFSHIAHGAIAKGSRVWIMAHRVELVDQISRTLYDFDVPHGFIAAGYPPSMEHQVQVCSTQTLVRRMESNHRPDLIIVDEAHHSLPTNTIGRILGEQPSARVLGVTATPWRLSGEGLGDTFSAMVLGPTVQHLIDLGALSPVKVYAPPGADLSGLHMRMGEFVQAEVSAAMDKPKITGDAVEHYRRLAHGKRAVAFCTSVEHARHVAAEFRDAGYAAMHIDGGMDRDTRKSAVQQFQKGEINVLTSCELVSEGFDCPGIEVGISLRPTASLGLWLQQCGRCLRTVEGKSTAIILDHAGNTLRHGLPTDDREWSLSGSKSTVRRTAEAVVSVTVCPQCFSAQASGPGPCKNCGHQKEVKGRSIEEAEGELEEVKASPRRKVDIQRATAQTLESLVALGKARGYASAERWAKHVYEARMRKRA